MRRSYKKTDLPSKVKAIEKKVARLGKSLDALDGELIYRDVNYQNATSTENEVSYLSSQFMTVANMRSALMQLRYYDIDVPGTLKVVDLDDSSFQIDARIVSASISMEIRANYLTPVHYTVWFASVTADTSYSPTTYMAQVDEDSINTSYTDLSVWPHDFVTLKNFYSLKRLGSGILQPGQSKTFIHRMKGMVTYNTSEVDAHNIAAQRKYKSGHLMMRYHGALAHDKVTVAAVGVPSASIDAVVKKFMTIKYNAGGNIKYIYINSDESAFAEGPNLTNKPIAAQQANTA